MARKEEINVAASEYIEDNSMPDGYTAISDHKDSFIEGANWADSHPVNVWHDVSEEPKYGEWFLAKIGNGTPIVITIMAIDRDQDWEIWSNNTNIKMWAYIDELLPKECKK